MDSDASPTVIILVTRGDELPKKNYETKLHPTYEVRKIYIFITCTFILNLVCYICLDYNTY